MGSKTLLPRLFVLFLFVGCAGGAGSGVSSQQNTGNTSSNPVPSGQPPKKLDPAAQVQANFQKHFESKKTLGELAQDQTSFLTSKRWGRLEPREPKLGGPKTVLMAQNKSKGDRMYAPLISSYGTSSHIQVNTGTDLSLKVPSDFLPNVPAEIKAAISEYDLDEVELFLVVQSGSSLAFLDQSQNIMLLSHLWGLGKDSFFDRTMDMGIFDSDKDISREIQIGTLLPFNVNVHSSEKGGIYYSPNTAGLNIKTSILDLSFYSVVVDFEKKKAAVTFHLLISGEHTLVDTGEERIFLLADYDSVREFLDRLHDYGKAYFGGTPLLQKLDDLFRVASE